MTVRWHLVIVAAKTLLVAIILLIGALSMGCDELNNNPHSSPHWCEEYGGTVVQDERDRKGWRCELPAPKRPTVEAP